jgi:hypothetical protein
MRWPGWTTAASSAAKKLMIEVRSGAPARKPPAAPLKSGPGEPRAIPHEWPESDAPAEGARQPGSPARSLPARAEAL